MVMENAESNNGSGFIKFGGEVPLNRLRRLLNGVFLITLASAAWRKEDAGEDEASVS